MVETQIKLIAVELEEEKASLIQLILMTGITLLFNAFSFMYLLGLVFWSVDLIATKLSLSLQVS